MLELDDDFGVSHACLRDWRESRNMSGEGVLSRHFSGHTMRFRKGRLDSEDTYRIRYILLSACMVSIGAHGPVEVEARIMSGHEGAVDRDLM